MYEFSIILMNSTDIPTQKKRNENVLLGLQVLQILKSELV